MTNKSEKAITPENPMWWDNMDPINFKDLCWPHLDFYKEQKDIIYSVRNNKETIVPAGHMLGKDFITAFIVLWFFLSRNPCRIITTSVDSKQLEGVLWGEMTRFLQESKYPLTVENGGCLIVNHQLIRKQVEGQRDGLSYILGRVAEKGEGMSGHHIGQTGDNIPRTLFCLDEGSGIDALTYEKGDEWANRMLVIGNPYDCANYFKWAVKGKPGSKDKGGDILSPNNDGTYLRKIIKIKADASPNVRYAKGEIKQGKEPSHTIIIPGVLPYADYLARRIKWDETKQCVGLDAEFPEGADILMYPPGWLNEAEIYADELASKRQGVAIGIDPAEGGDSTVWSVVDHSGLIYQCSMKTPNTAIITGKTLALMNEYNVKADKVVFDRGGGGKQHADKMREQGHKVRTVAFGESVTPEKRRGVKPLEHRKLDDEERYRYKNRRIQMYHQLRLLLDPNEGQSFGLPIEYDELRRQLSPLPLLYNGEGTLYLPPKNKRSPNSTEQTIQDIIGCSPDESDSLVLAVYGMLNKSSRAIAGII